MRQECLPADSRISELKTTVTKQIPYESLATNLNIEDTISCIKMYHYQSNATNVPPDNAWGFLMHFSFNINSKIQVAVTHAAHIYIRVKSENWGSWAKVF